MNNETWLLDVGDRVIRKKASTGWASLSSLEALVYCIWVADYGMRNAGDLDTASDLFTDFQTDGTRIAKSLSLPIIHRAFSRSKEELERSYFDEFDSMCDELRMAQSAKTLKVGGDWFHSHQEKHVVDAIQSSGWKPDLNSGTKFGCGVYLARGQWHSDAKWMIRCAIQLADSEVLDEFPVVKGFENKGSGNSEGHFERYLKAEGVTPGRARVEGGNSAQNMAIREYFLKKGIKAVKFVEHGIEALVVYDVSAITITDVTPL